MQLLLRPAVTPLHIQLHMQQARCERILRGGARARLRVLPRGHGQLPVVAPVFQFTLLLQWRLQQHQPLFQQRLRPSSRTPCIATLTHLPAGPRQGT